MGVMSEGFSGNPLQSISINCAFRTFFGDGETQLWIRIPFLVHQHGPVSIRKPLVLFEYARVVSRGQ